MAEVCKFFLQGRCRFGDRCRYKHPTNTDGGGRGYRHQRDPSFDTGRRWDRKPDTNRFQLFSDTTRSYDSNRDTRGGYGGGSGGGGRRGSDRGGRGGGGGREWDTGRDSGRNSWDNQRRDDYRGQSYRGDRYSGGQYRSGPGRGGGQSSRYGDWNRNYDSRSFQNQSDGSYRSSNRYSTHDQATFTNPSEIATQIRSDMEEWQKHMIWPFSCYAYHKETPCLPGFADVSPEEVRWEAYQAKTKGTSEQYLRQIRDLSEEHSKALGMYASATASDVEKLTSGQLPSSPLFGSPGGRGAIGADLFSPSANTGSTVSSLFGPSSPLQNAASLFGSSSSGTQSQSLFQSTNQSFTTNIGTSPQPVTTTTSSLFTSQPSSSATLPPTNQQTHQQQQPSTTTAHVVSTTASVETVKVEQLTKEDLEVFKAEKFTLGKIPERAPSKDLC